MVLNGSQSWVRAGTQDTNCCYWIFENSFLATHEEERGCKLVNWTRMEMLFNNKYLYPIFRNLFLAFQYVGGEEWDQCLGLWDIFILTSLCFRVYLAVIYLFIVNNRKTRTRCKICSKLTIKTPERRRRRLSSVFIANFVYISQLFLLFLKLTLNK